jgi:F0F1-type ATP synthase assembly protein I
MSKALAQGSTIGVQAGCISVILVLLALVVGLALDQVFHTKPLFVLGLLLLSIPVSLYAMVRSVLASSKSMREAQASETPKKEDGSGEQTH